METFTLTRVQIAEKLNELEGVTKYDIVKMFTDWMNANHIGEFERKQILNDLESYPEFRLKGLN